VLFVERGDFDPTTALAMLSSSADVTYNFVCNDVKVATQTATVSKGSEYPAFNVTLPLGYEITEQKPEGTVQGDHTEEITVVVNNSLLPFEAVAEGTPSKWYYAQMHYYTTDDYSYRWFIAPAEDGSSVRTQDHEFAANEVDAHLWGFVGTVEGGFKMVNKATKEAIKSNNDGVAAMAEVAAATAFTVMPSPTNGWFCLRHPEGNYLNSQGSISLDDFVIKHWNDNDNGSSFFLTEYVEIPVVVSEAGYSTLYLGQATYIPAEVEAYAVTSVENGYAMMTQVEGVLPANTGVVLKNTGDYTFKVAGATGSVEGNLLRGSTEVTYVEGDALVLSKQDGVVGFYKAQLNCGSFGEAGGSHFKNNANKAYLPMTATQGANMLRFNFGGETTAIDAVEVENANAPIYDLSGRRVLTTVKGGVYIQNGKKFIVK
jgi:hypothetical protein